MQKYYNREVMNQENEKITINRITEIKNFLHFCIVTGQCLISSKGGHP
jgi:hypothetical protein